MTRFYISTFGCRCNQADSAAIRHDLCRSSMQEAGSHIDADLVVVNTCTVTHRTDQQVRQAVRKLHRDNPDARIVVTGCYAERDPGTLSQIQGVALVVGNGDKERMSEIIRDEACDRVVRIVRSPLDQERDFLVPPMSQTGGKTRPFVKLQDGCDARCSYCIVPSVRGPGRSARPESVTAEIRALVERGYQEIVLTGVHLGTYGRKLDNRPTLVDLLRRILDIPGLGRLRLSSVEPMRFNRSIVKLAASTPAFAPHFHIPLQSGSDRILRRMRRPYTAARFLDLLQYVRSELPSAGLGTDVLAGFPGETDEDFERTCDVVRQAPLTYMHVFPFSRREGTDAFGLPLQISPDVIQQRTAVLRRMSQEKNLAFRRSFMGQVLPALTLAKEEELGDSVVLTENYIHARVAGHRIPPNRLVRVRIDEVEETGTRASIVDT